MNLPRINFSSLFSPRIFIYFLFALVILILLVEGGYYLFFQKKAAKPAHTDWVNLIEGEIKEIEERTLIISVKDNSFIPKKVEIELADNAKIFIPPSGDLFEKPFPVEEEEQMRFALELEAVARESISFADLKVGALIQAGSLTKLAGTKFKAESIAVIR